MSLQRWLLIGAAIFVIGFSWLFWRESHRILDFPLTTWTQDHTGDCGIVLTGGAGRIREGVDLLAQGLIKKLIIAGAHPQATLRQIVPVWPFHGDLEEKDVILEKHSTTTYGNSQQSLLIVEALRCREVVLITSHLHMYRASHTFRGTFPPEIPITEHATAGGTLEPSWPEVAIETIKSLFYSLWAYA